jgi:hypothetical protein
MPTEIERSKKNKKKHHIEPKAEEDKFLFEQ